MGIYSINELYTMNTLPDIMYFSSSEKINKLKGKVFLSPYIGISSMFIIPKHSFKSIKGYSCNIGYKEWNFPDNKLNKPLDVVHVTHTVKEIKDVETGMSSGYIYKVDISKIKDKLSLFVTNDPNREVIYNGEEPLKIIEVLHHKLKWSCQFDQENADIHGYGKPIKESKGGDIMGIYSIEENKSNESNNLKWTLTNEKIWEAEEFIDGRSYRPRVEMIIFNKDKIFLYKTDKINQYGNTYKIPGGGIAKGKSIVEQAINEVHEEALINVKNVKETNIIYIKDFNGKYPQWHIEKLHPLGIKYEGVITHVLVGEYNGKYNKDVNEHDKDDIKNGKFYKIDDIYNILSPEHKQVVDIYQTEKNVNETTINPLNYIIIEEATSERKYKCPFCDYRDTRENLVFHVEDEHQDMIPQDYTPARVVFNYLNKKEHGSCIICKQETKWIEDKWRYDRLCKMESCRIKYTEIVQSRMVSKYGKKNLLGDPEQQKKMLANRAISGTYKFNDGGVRSYCGSYEKKTLEFMDSILNVNSKDVMTPGPIIEYEYKGQKLKWITDIFYAPFNLVMDVKDGGDNPNNRQMDDYRAKQIAKEKAIAELKQYNYLRLTDNDFSQLLLTMNMIKKQLIDYPDSEDVVININEYTAIAGINPVIHDTINNDDVYLIPYGMNNTFLGTLLSTDKYFDRLIMMDYEGKFVNESIEFLYPYDFSVYKYKGNKKLSELKTLVKECNDNFYTLLTGKELLSPDQIAFDENFEEVPNPYIEKSNSIRTIVESIEYQYNQLIGNDLSFGLTSMKDISLKESIVSQYNNMDIKQDLDGYFVYNESSQTRSKSYDKITHIPKDVLENINCKTKIN